MGAQVLFRAAKHDLGVTLTTYPRLTSRWRMSRSFSSLMPAWRWRDNFTSFYKIGDLATCNVPALRRLRLLIRPWRVKLQSYNKGEESASWSWRPIPLCVNKILPNPNWPNPCCQRTNRVVCGNAPKIWRKVKALIGFYNSLTTVTRNCV
jgi:hypothetical protein